MDSIFFDVQNNPELLSKVISEYRPDIIVNCIAIVSVDFCEEEQKSTPHLVKGFYYINEVSSSADKADENYV